MKRLREKVQKKIFVFWPNMINPSVMSIHPPPMRYVLVGNIHYKNGRCALFTGRIIVRVLAISKNGICVEIKKIWWNSWHPHKPDYISFKDLFPEIISSHIERSFVLVYLEEGRFVKWWNKQASFSFREIFCNILKITKMWKFYVYCISIAEETDRCGINIRCRVEYLT